MLSLKPSHPETKKPPKQPPDPVHQLTKPNSLNSVLHHNPRTCLLLAVFSVQLLLLLHLRSLRPPAAPIAPPIPADPCKSGRVYVYDLPPRFNTEILAGCADLTPWGSGCDFVSNSGFGRRAAAGVSGLVPEDLTPAWFWTDQFTSEVIFHNRMLNHRCRVSDPGLATAYYVPFYAGLALGKHLWKKSSSSEDKDRDCNTLLEWLSRQKYYRRSQGWDHFITMGRITWDFRSSDSKNTTWGSSCINFPGMRNVTRLLIERNPWDAFDVGVPYPTGFHPSSAAEVTAWQNFLRRRSHRRSTLFCFAGATRGLFKNDFRAALLRHCEAERGACAVVDCGGSRCSNGTSAILETFLGSEFCLQPRGDSFTRRSIFDCMVAGSIPVFFWKRTAYYQYQWFLPSDPTSYSVYIDRNSVKNGSVTVRSVLESYSEDEKRRMREKIIDYIPKLVYSLPHQGLGTVKDAFDTALDGVFKRFKDQQQVGINFN